MTHSLAARHLLALAALAVLASAGACAQETPAAPDPDAKVEVSAIRNPDLKKYRSLVAGLDEFEDKRARYAPNAPELRFRFWPRTFGKGDPLANLQLKISGESESFLVPLDANGSFAVLRNERAYDEDADLILNRKKGELRAFPYVRTPGLPSNVRRLGDHRLECRVIVAVAKKDIGLLLTATINTILLTTDWCSSSKGSWGMDSEYELDGATLREGGRSEELVVRGRSYQIPMHDPAWSNDALIELRPMHEPTPEEMAKPFGRTMYVFGLKGSGKGGYRLRKVEEGVFRTQAWLGKAKHEFKIGAANFEGIDLGAAAGSEAAKPGAPVALAGKGGNIALQIDKGAEYIFTVDVREEAAPRLTVTPVPAAKD